MFYEADDNEDDEESETPSEGPLSSTDTAVTTSSDEMNSNDPIMKQIVSRPVLIYFKLDVLL